MNEPHKKGVHTFNKRKTRKIFKNPRLVEGAFFRLPKKSGRYWCIKMRHGKKLPIYMTDKIMNAKTSEALFFPAIAHRCAMIQLVDRAASTLALS